MKLELYKILLLPPKQIAPPYHFEDASVKLQLVTTLFEPSNNTAPPIFDPSEVQLVNTHESRQLSSLPK